MSTQYYLERNRNNLKKINLILNSLPDFCSLFFIGMQNSTTPLTRLNYANDLKIFFNYLNLCETPFTKKEIKNFDLQDLNKIDSLMIERFLGYLSSYDDDEGKIHNNSEHGKARKLSSIRSFLEFYFYKDLITANVATKVKIPKMHTKDIVRLEENEVDELLDMTQTLQGFSTHQQKYNQKLSLRDNAIISLFLGTGIRVSECVGLNIEDIDFINNSFRVIRKGGNQVILYLNSDLKEILQNYVEYRKSLPEVAEDEKALFLTIQNKRMGVRSMENLVHKYAKVITPLKNISPHKLRSTFGTNLYRATKDIYVVADVLGHKDVNTTKKHYAAISEDIRKDAAKMVKLRNN